jgi:hypothetical protein
VLDARFRSGLLVVALFAAWSGLCPSASFAQTPDQQSSPQPERADPDVRIDPLQPDFNLAALPTTLRMPRGKWAFRVTHRFTRPVGQGEFSDLVRDMFGFDSSAQIGLELRYGIAPGTQVGVHRTSDRTIQIFGQHNFVSERREGMFGMDLLAGFEGQNNMREEYRGIVGLVFSKNVGGFAAVYAEPILVTNTNALDAEGTDDYTMFVGLGTRLRVLPALYLVGEVSPRIAGFDLDKHQISFGVESRAGGHTFQLNFSNGFGTTLSQVARGGITYDDWFIGFNISRKFF